jgi:hypothetical protein
MARTQSEKIKQFIRLNQVEWDWRDIDGIRDVVAWINIKHLEAFCSIFGDDFFNEYEIDCAIQNKEVAVPFYHISKWLGVKLENLFGPDPQPK